MAKTSFGPHTRERLIVALLMEDVVRNINTALSARKAALTIDYTNHSPALRVSMPMAKPETWMVAHVRSKTCLMGHPTDPSLDALILDINERLAKYEAWLKLSVQKRPNTKAEAKLQVYVGGVRQTALTLMSAFRGRIETHTNFTLPKSST